MISHLTPEEYANVLDYFVYFEVKRLDSIEVMFAKMGLKRNGIGSKNHIIVDKQMWMLAKIKHGF